MPKTLQILRSKTQVGASKKGKVQTANQGLLKISKSRPKPMNGQTLGLKKKGKGKKKLNQIFVMKIS